MLKIKDIPAAEMHELLMSASFGHLGCAREGWSYVLPMNYAYDGKELYFYATEGMKTQFMDGNPHVCLQVEEILDSSHWRSVMIIGRAQRLTNPNEIRRAVTQLTERSPSLAAVIDSPQPGASVSATGIALYRIQPELMNGRKAVPQD